MSLLLQNLICLLLLALALLGLVRGYGLLGRGKNSSTGCSKGCGACQSKAAAGIEELGKPSLVPTRVRRFRLHH